MNAVTTDAVAASPDSSVTGAAATQERLRITEIFLSLQGEARDAGWPTVFVRLTGCPLRCQYCDTAYAFHGGQWWELDAIAAEVATHGVRHVCVTGGEPLSQKRCIPLLQRLCDAGYSVSLETSGAIDISEVDPRVSRVLDIKTPGSAEAHRNRWENLPLLTAHDQVKFVICSRADFDWARAVVAEHGLADTCDVLFSPSFSQVAPRELADWIVAEKLPVRFQMQLHKLLWNDEPRAMKPAVILLSGGMDSAVVLAIAREQGFAVHALSVRYGQRHTSELDAANRIAVVLGAVAHKTVSVDLRSIGGSALTDDGIGVPLDNDRHPVGVDAAMDDIPVTYVPARNTIMLSVALGWAEVLGAADIFCGVNAVDYSGYPDCRPEFIEAFEALANLATKAGVEGAGIRVHAPLLRMSKADIVREGKRLGVDFAQTVSCYQADAQGRACGHCDACRLRAAGFDAAGIADPTHYVQNR